MAVIRTERGSLESAWERVERSGTAPGDSMILIICLFARICRHSAGRLPHPRLFAAIPADRERLFLHSLLRLHASGLMRAAGRISSESLVRRQGRHPALCRASHIDYCWRGALGSGVIVIF